MSQLSTEAIDKLVKAAAQARMNSYSPYSSFSVGAALLTENDEMFTGANVENASYPCGICAEKVAYAKAITATPTRPSIKAIAVVAKPLGPSQFVTPCGNCRQFMSEFGKETVVICATDPSPAPGAVTIAGTFTLATLLPHSFSADDLSQ
ncbi:hypothetical protein MDAP_000534 [Mitosporidium daphniae]